MRRVEAQLQSPGVRLTLRVLKQARRIIAVAALEGGNTGIDHANKVRSGGRRNAHGRATAGKDGWRPPHLFPTNPQHPNPNSHRW